MQNYHPTRVITLIYQPFVLATTAIFTYHEAKVNTRVRNLAGYILFFLSSFGVIIVSAALMITAYLHLYVLRCDILTPNFTVGFIYASWIFCLQEVVELLHSLVYV